MVLVGDSPQTTPDKLTYAGEAAFEAIDRLERRISNWIEESPVSVMNRRASEGPVVVDPDLFGLMETSRRFYNDTDARCSNVTVGPLLALWGFYRDKGVLPTPEQLAAARESVGMNRVELDPAARSVRFTRPGMRVDFGGIGKGLALDRAAEILRQNGVNRARLHSSTSTIVVMGTPPASKTWGVEITWPFEDPEKAAPARDGGWRSPPASPSRPPARASAMSRLTGNATPTSSTRGPAGPWTRTSAAPRPSPPTGTESDALSTAFFILGEDGARAYCAKAPGRARPAGGGAGGAPGHRADQLPGRGKNEEEAPHERRQPAGLCEMRGRGGGIPPSRGGGLPLYLRAETAGWWSAVSGVGGQGCFHLRVVPRGHPGHPHRGGLRRRVGAQPEGGHAAGPPGQRQQQLAEGEKPTADQIAAAEALPKPNVYYDYREMLEKETLDGVIIASPCSPTPDHAGGLDAGKYVFCEKTLVSTVEEGRAVVTKCHDTRKWVQVGHQRRYNPKYNLAMGLVYDRETVGRVTHITAQWHRHSQWRRPTPSDYVLNDEEKKYITDLRKHTNWRIYADCSGGLYTRARPPHQTRHRQLVPQGRAQPRLLLRRPRLLEDGRTTDDNNRHDVRVRHPPRRPGVHPDRLPHHAPWTPASPTGATPSASSTPHPQHTPGAAAES